MPIAKFRALGYLQEVNRLLLHPLGLALEVVVAEDGTEFLGGVWGLPRRSRGVCYDGANAPRLERAHYVIEEFLARKAACVAALVT
jgi:hypothetical protein